MLLELNIKDLAIIDELSLELGPGFNVFTGETGAGKSIIIDAIDLVLGGRASTELVRSSKDEARVEALFDLSDASGATGVSDVAALLSAAGLPVEENLLIKRIVSRSGRSRIFINGSMANGATLAAIGRLIIDVYGQSEHQALTKVEEHIDMLDDFGGLLDMKEAMADTYSRWSGARRDLDKVQAEIKKAIEDRELLEFQSSEIEEAALDEGEEEELTAEHGRLKNSERILKTASDGSAMLYGAEGAVLEKLGWLVGELKELARYDKQLGSLAERLESASFEVEDVATTLRDYGGAFDPEPGRLLEIEERLDLLIKLKRKYGGTLKDVLVKKQEIDEKLLSITDCEGRKKELEEALAALTKEAADLSGKLTRSRRKAAGELKKGIEGELAELGMKGTLFEAELESALKEDGTPQFTASGSDKVRFLIATNKGEDLKLLSKVASGGELSRIMLAMKGITSVGKVATLIFDEVDTGIGGPMSRIVGAKLKEVSAAHQTLCITHMPQIAAFADNHYLVEKKENAEGRVVSSVRKLTGQEHLERVAMMLGGEEPTGTTLKHAEEMIGASGT
ncbi:DNA repair protein RecN [hydrothermal vent metagenome]|uniref:DNA repair protein RecN n=1 Tax=hydrothermal vent metagenome TaxID=652676 RepID=A0A3B0QT57_9ZZZZ